MTRSLTLSEIASELGAQLIGDGTCQITGLNTLQDAASGELAFLANQRYATFLDSCRASAVIVASQEVAGSYAGNLLVMKNPYLGYAKATHLFVQYPGVGRGVHPTAVVAPTASVHPSASVGPCTVIGEKVTVGESTVIGSGCHIGDGASLGSACRLADNVTLYYGVSLGNQVTVHSGAVIGADGFGFAHDGKGWEKIHQLGSVVIGNRVEIGACTTIDRGALGDTIVEDGVIMDNHVQIAHNVKIGKNTAMAAFSGISGSTEVGENCIFAGQSGVVGHVKVCAGVTVTAGTIITKSITTPGSYSGGTGFSDTSIWRKNAARFAGLGELAKRVAKLEKKLSTGPKNSLK